MRGKTAIVLCILAIAGWSAQQPSPTPDPMHTPGQGKDMSLAEQLGNPQPSDSRPGGAGKQQQSSGDNARGKAQRARVAGQGKTGYEQQIADYHKDITKSFQNFTKLLGKLDSGDSALIYIVMQQAKQTNLVLQQQNEILKTLKTMNANIQRLMVEQRKMRQASLQARQADYARQSSESSQSGQSRQAKEATHSSMMVPR